MKSPFWTVLLVCLLFSFWHTACEHSPKGRTGDKMHVTHEIPEFEFNGQLVHRGAFSPDSRSYFITLSDPQFERFDVLVSAFEYGQWRPPTPVFFNSPHSEHGISFSPDGQSLYFSSTQPLDQADSSQTWHLWKSEYVNCRWGTPQPILLPGLEGQLCSHPSITDSGKLYFHSSNPDYSEMHLFSAQETNGAFTEGQKVIFPGGSPMQMCTPWVAPDESYLLFAGIGDQLDLYMALKGDSGKWGTPIPLNSTINTKGQGNPNVSSDGKWLNYTTGSEPIPGKPLDWKVRQTDFPQIMRQVQSDHANNLK